MTAVSKVISRFGSNTKHVRNAETNKAHRVQVRAGNWLDRGGRTPGHPLYTTSSRTLRFSIGFTDAFAQGRMDGMTFLGMCCYNPWKPDIMRHPPKDIDIQSEHGATATMCYMLGASTQLLW